MKKILIFLYESYKKILKVILFPFIYVAAKSRFLSKMLLIFSNDFDLECFEVVNGKKSFLLNKKNNEFQLRRNIHRMEKAISMPNRRSTFALGYVDETVSLFTALLDDNKAVCNSLCTDYLWYYSVLKNYFDVVDKKDNILLLKKKFDDVSKKHHFTKKKDLIDLSVNKIKPCYKGLKQLVNYRRSVRHYTNQEVSDDVLKKSVDMARMSPSACNRQPFRFIAIKDQDKIKKVMKLILGNSGFSEFIPCITVVVGNLEASYESRDRHIMYIDSSLAAMNYVNALTSQGVGSCCMNWTSVLSREKAMRKIIDIKPFEHFVMFISVGYPDYKVLVPSSLKYPVDRLLEIKK